MRQQMLYVLLPVRYSMPAWICIGCGARGRWTASSSRSGGVGSGRARGGELVDYWLGRWTRGSSGRKREHGFRSGLVLAPYDDRTRRARLIWNSFTGEVAWQPRLRVSRAFGQTSTWAGYAIQAQHPSHQSLQSFEFLDFSEENTTRLQNACTEQVVAGFERSIRAGAEPAGRRLPPHVRRPPGAAAGNGGRAPKSPCRLRHSPGFPVRCRHPRVSAHGVSDNVLDGASGWHRVPSRRDRGRVTGWLGYTLSKSTRALFGQPCRLISTARRPMPAWTALLGARFRAAATWQLASGFPVMPIQREVELKANHLDGTGDGAIASFRDRKLEIWS